MNYQVITIQDNNDFFWGVAEMQTEQIIDTFFFQEDAVEYATFLEKGGAFAGFTPSFILTEVKIPESLDESFSREFDLTE